MKKYSHIFAILILTAIGCSKQEPEEKVSEESTVKAVPVLNEDNSTEPATTDTSKEPNSTIDNDSEINIVPEEENVKLGKHSSTAKSLMKLMNGFIDNLSLVRDKESAEAAVAKFDDMAESFEKIASEMEALGKPTGQEAQAVITLFEQTEKELQEKLSGIMGFLLGDEEVGKIITPALQKFGERMSDLDPLMEKWSGKSGQANETPPIGGGLEKPLESTIDNENE